MNETIYEGTNLEDALGKATEALGLAVDELQYEVTEESDGGFWGVDEAFVRLRAWPRTEDSETAEDDADALPEDDADAFPIEEAGEDESQAAPPAKETSTTAAPVDPPAEVSAEPVGNTREPEPTGAENFWAAAEDNAALPDSGDEAAACDDVPTRDSAPVASEDAPKSTTTEPFASDISGAPERDVDAAEEETPAREEAPPGEGDTDRGATPATSDSAETEEGDGDDLAADASPEIESLVSKILAGMEFDCTIDVQAEAEVYMAMVGGADNELLLEGNGRPLSALELILNHAFRHRLTARRKIRVDAGDFRSRREDELRDLAYQVAHSAKESERTQETQPLNPYERRLVHLALAEDSGVTTRSRGSGFLKNVQVIPRRSGRGNR